MTAARRAVEVTDGMRDEAARMVVYGGHTMREVAERYGVSAKSVSRWVHRLEQARGKGAAR